MNKTEALTLLRENIKNENMIKHCIASGAVMAALAQKLGTDAEVWRNAGILHDIDVEAAALKGDLMKTHCTLARALLAGKLPEESICAIEAHNESADIRPRASMFDHALAAGETITGLITATAYVYPDRKLASVKVKSITKRMKEKSFAASVSRENIMECEKLGIPLEDFAALALKAMQDIAGELGL
ncbi:MAG: HDIG domain-containing protein [Elusimicrobiota bacterium]|jgi:putative nucleotidyltransferase with HDIG domain|nr:HDIG domain-containing protein [Elusimicrobiota bacterium]